MSASLIRALAELTIAASVAILVVAAMRRPLRRVGGARAAYLCWLLIPASQLVVSVPPPVEPVAAAWQAIPQWGARALSGVVSADGVIADARQAAIDYAVLAVAVWVAGALAMLIVVGLRQRAFIRSLGVLEAMPDGTYRSAALRDPLLLGAWRPRVVLPADFESRYDADDRALVLAHERAHQRRGDTLVNGIATIWLCVSWFNPLMYWAVARLRFDQELACDEVAVAARPTQRRRYADALLRTQLAADAGLPAPLACPWRSRHPLKERIVMLVRPLPTTLRRRFGALLSYAALAAGSYALWTMLPGSAHAQAGPEQTTMITARSVRFVSEQGRNITFVAHDFETPLGDGNNDFEVTQRADRDRTGLYSPVKSAGPAALIADRVSRLANGDLELSGLIVKLLPGVPNGPVEFERVRIDFESGVLTDNARNGEPTPFAKAWLTTDRAIVQDDGTIRVDSAVLTLVAEQ